MCTLLYFKSSSRPIAAREMLKVEIQRPDQMADGRIIALYALFLFLFLLLILLL